MNQFTRNLMLWGVISLAMVIVFNLFSQPQHSSQPSVTYSEFLRQAAKGEVSEVVIQGNTANRSRFTSPTIPALWINSLPRRSKSGPSLSRTPRGT